MIVTCEYRAARGVHTHPARTGTFGVLGALTVWEQPLFIIHAYVGILCIHVYRICTCPTCMHIRVRDTCMYKYTQQFYFAFGTLIPSLCLCCAAGSCVK